VIRRSFLQPTGFLGILGPPPEWFPSLFSPAHNALSVFEIGIAPPGDTSSSSFSGGWPLANNPVFLVFFPESFPYSHFSCGSGRLSRVCACLQIGFVVPPISLPVGVPLPPSETAPREAEESIPFPTLFFFLLTMVFF